MQYQSWSIIQMAYFQFHILHYELLYTVQEVMAFSALQKFQLACFGTTSAMSDMSQKLITKSSELQDAYTLLQNLLTANHLLALCTNQVYWMLQNYLVIMVCR